LKRRKSKRRHLVAWAGEDTINLTPLLDVIFNLIFFFLLATTLKQTRAFLEVRLPHATRSQVAEAPKKTLVITLTGEDRIFVETRELTLEELERELRETAPGDVDRMILRGDAMAHHQAVVRVLDACARAGHFGVAVEVKSDTVK